MWQSGFYSYLPLLFVVFAGLFLARWDRIWRVSENRFSHSLIAAGIVGLVVAIARFSPWLGTLSWIFFVGAFLVSQSGKVFSSTTPLSLKFFRNAGPANVALLWPLVWMCIRLPRNLDHWLAAKVELLSLKMSSFVLDMFGVPHRVFADLIELRDVRIPVDQIFSGIQSTFSLGFIAILIVVLLGRSVWLVPIYLSAAGFWSVLMNVIRMVATVCARAWYDWDWTTGWQHAALNLTALAVVVLCLLSSDRLLKVVFFPTKPDGLDSMPNPLVSLWNQLFWPPTQQPRPASNGTSLQQ